MPLIQCSGCRATFDVELSTIGRKVRCPKCKTSFTAASKMSGPRRKQQSQAPLWIGGTVLAMVILFLAVTIAKNRAEPDEPVATADTRGAGRSAEKAEEASPAPTFQENKDAVQATVEDFLTAVQEEDEAEVLRRLSCPRIQDQRAAAGEGERWEDLDDVGRAVARERIASSFLGTEEEQEFLRQASLEDYKTTRLEKQTAEAVVLYRSLVEEGLQQERTFRLARVQDRWMVVAMESGPIHDPAIEAARRKAEQDKERRARRQRTLYAPIETQEWLVETTPEERSTIEDLAAKLTDLNLTREASKARRELIAIGKPAIPALLNLVVGREDMASTEDQLILNQAVLTLRSLTHEEFGFSPSTLSGTMTGETLEANQAALQRWFGWWRTNRDTWTGPPENTGDDEEEE